MTDPDDPSPDDLPAVPETDTLARILWFVEQCRKRGIRVGPHMRVGDVQLQIKDLRQAAVEGYGTNRGEGPGIWEQAGFKEEE